MQKVFELVYYTSRASSHLFASFLLCATSAILLQFSTPDSIFLVIVFSSFCVLFSVFPNKLLSLISSGLSEYTSPSSRSYCRNVDY